VHSPIVRPSCERSSFAGVTPAASARQPERHWNAGVAPTVTPIGGKNVRRAKNMPGLMSRALEWTVVMIGLAWLFVNARRASTS
jgi:hypothetical protein